MDRVFCRDDLPTMEKWVAIALADVCNDEGVGWPAVSTLAEKCSCSERTVQNALRGLEGKHLLRIIKRKDRSSMYVFNLAAMPKVERERRYKERGPHAELIAAEDELDLFISPEISTRKSTGASPAPVQITTGTGAGDSVRGESPAPRTVIEPSIEPSDSGDFKSPDAVLDSENQVLAIEPTASFVEREWKELTEKHPGIAAVRKIDEGLRHSLELRGKQHALEGETPIDVWRMALACVAASPFLRGEAPPGPGRERPFRLTLGWMATASHFREILGGKYSDNRNPNAPPTHSDTGRRLGPSEQAYNLSLARLRSARERGRSGGSASSDHAASR